MPHPVPVISNEDDTSDIVKVSPPSSNTYLGVGMDEKPRFDLGEKKMDDVQAMVDETVRKVRAQSDR